MDPTAQYYLVNFIGFALVALSIGGAACLILFGLARFVAAQKGR